MRERMPERGAGASAEAEEGEAMLSLAAFTATVERLQRPLSAFLRGMVGDGEQALDLTQDAFHDAWRATQRGDAPWTAAGGDDEARRRWLFHTAYWRAVSQLRRRKIIHWLPLERPWPAQGARDGQSGDGASEAERVDGAAAFEERVVEGEALRAALAKLAPEDAAALLLRAVEGFSAAEAAAIMRISPAAMAQRISRARRRLRAIYLAQNPPEGAAGGKE
ncbi:MAG TPA: sigma-70 family RNA polymerase sigma factor [Ktedonobacterales bacterium]|nr:sigma-70 family RNA polymerase sigma factor [Ktedonobacterales bacterium]